MAQTKAHVPSWCKVLVQEGQIVTLGYCLKQIMNGASYPINHQVGFSICVQLLPNASKRDVKIPSNMLTDRKIHFILNLLCDSMFHQVDHKKLNY